MEPPKQLIPTKFIFLFCGAILVLSVSMIIKDEYKDVGFSLTSPIISLPQITNPFDTDQPKQVSVYGDIWDQLLGDSRKNDSDDCQNKNCGNERGKINERTDCDAMIRDYKKYPDWPLKPTLAKRIVNYCWEKYH